MSTVVSMPRLSDSMEEGTIVEWLVAEGESVERDQQLVEIETDKATVVYNAESNGVLHLVARASATIPVGEVIAHLLADGELPPAPTDQSASIPDPAAVLATVAELPARVHELASNGTRPKASPLARRVAREIGITLRGLPGSGPNGRIMRADVEAAAISRGAPPRETAVTANPDTFVPLTNTQKTIARRMSEAKATIPEFQIRMEADVTALSKLRQDLKAAQVAVSINDFIVRACAFALRRHPLANASYRDASFRLSSAINVGIAVATDDALVVPVIHDTDKLTIGQIATKAQASAERVRRGVITPPELAAGTFTVSNLGMFGVTSFTAIVNPGQAAILAVGAARETLKMHDGAVTNRKVLDLSLTCDHRILYGATAARFLADIRDQLEQPLRLAVDI